MSDFFNNYCINCDKLCTSSSIYCSDKCRQEDEAQASHPHTHHANGESILRSNAHTPELVSPLLTASYNNADGSPMFYSSASTPVEYQEDDLDNYPFDLNYSYNSPYTHKSSEVESLTAGSEAVLDLSSTSHNYRKWLTVCL